MFKVWSHNVQYYTYSLSRFPSNSAGGIIGALLPIIVTMSLVGRTLSLCWSCRLTSSLTRHLPAQLGQGFQGGRVQAPEGIHHDGDESCPESQADIATRVARFDI